MSIRPTHTDDERALSCACDRPDCTERYRRGDDADGHVGYCSRGCWALHTATRTIEAVHGNHRFCASCYRRLREIDPSPSDRYFDRKARHVKTGYDQAKAATIGWAIPTPHTIEATGEQFRTRQGRDGVDVVAARDRYSHRRICSCGVTHHSTVERSELTKTECLTHAKRLSQAIDALQDVGTIKHDHEHDRQALLTAVASAKSKPDQQGDDGSIIRRALAVAYRLGDDADADHSL